jgi:hypothetical protein
VLTNVEGATLGHGVTYVSSRVVSAYRLISAEL